MSDSKFNVKPKSGDFTFTPDKLVVRVVSSDIISGKALVYYELRSSTIRTKGYITREWVERGNVEVPITLLAGSANHETGEVNAAVINAFLGAFNLELDTTPVDQEGGDPTGVL